MFTFCFLRRCYEKRIYLLIVLVLLDILSALYSGGHLHPLTRHMFISHDLVSGFANVLYWIVLFIPIGNDIIQEKSSFGVSLFCRISKSKYMIKKSNALFLYSVIFFASTMLISYATSFVRDYEIGQFIIILKTYILLVLIGYLILMFVCFIAWFSNSSYIMTISYVVIVTAMQIPVLQEKIAITNHTENFPRSVLFIVSCAITLLGATLFIMKRKDCIGMKKGMTI